MGLWIVVGALLHARTCGASPAATAQSTLCGRFHCGTLRAMKWLSDHKYTLAFAAAAGIGAAALYVLNRRAPKPVRQRPGAPGAAAAAASAELPAGAGADQSAAARRTPPEDRPVEEVYDKTSMAQESAFANEEAEKANTDGVVAYAERKFDDALKHFKRAVELDESTYAYTVNRGVVYLERGTNAKDVEDVSQSIQDFSTVLETAEGKSHNDVVAICYSLLGSAFFRIGAFNESITCLQRSINLRDSPNTRKKIDEVEGMVRMLQQQQQAILQSLSPEQREELERQQRAALEEMMRQQQQQQQQ